MTNLSMSNSVTTIGAWAFMSCSALTDVTIPKSLTSIGYGVFSGCYGLTDFYSYLTDFTDVSIDGYAFGLALYYGEVCDYSHRTLHVPAGMSVLYRSSDLWYPYFGEIVEMPVHNCDVNGDGVVNITDVNQVIYNILSDMQGDNGDVNGDGAVNISDVNFIINQILTTD